MKLRSRSALPPLDSTARLPLLLATLLVAALAFQLRADNDVPLPEAGPIAGGGARAPFVADLSPALGGPAIIARSIFAPRPTAPVSSTSPMSGVAIAGSIRIGRSQFAVVQGPGNRTTSVRIGGRVGGWRLRAIRQNDAVLTRNKEQIIVPFGARNVLPTTAAATGIQ